MLVATYMGYKSENIAGHQRRSGSLYPGERPCHILDPVVISAGSFEASDKSKGGNDGHGGYPFPVTEEM